MQSFIIRSKNQQFCLEQIKNFTKRDSIDNLLTSVDTLLIVPEISIGIEEVRQMREWVSNKPHNQPNKIVYIDNAEKLTIEAQNALLKVLEEPPLNVYLFLICQNSDVLLPTIQSRCQLISDPQFYEAENIQLDSALFNKIINSHQGKRLVIAEENGLFKDRQVAIDFINQFILYLRNLMLNQYNDNKQKSKSELLDQTLMLNMVKSAQKTAVYLNANVNVRLAIEVFLLDLPYGH